MLTPPPRAPRPDPFAGQQLGRYFVHSRLTVGGMSDVLLASYQGVAGFRRLAVLKQMLPDIRGKEDFVRMFLNEARMMALFSHPHIAQVYDLDVVDGELFLAMEFVPGATMIEIAQACHRTRELIPPGLTLMVVRDTARALHHAHTFTDPSGQPLAVVHRDVTQRNIMVTYEGITKLLDFGIAKLPDRTAHTAVGTLKGTSGYLSPEQIAGEVPDRRSDVFSLGIVLHECLTGARLFPGKTVAEALRNTLTAEILPPSSRNSAISPALDAVVMKALARKREERHATALELAQSLERASAGLLFHPEDAGELLRRLFHERHAEVTRLLADFRVPIDDLSDARIGALLARGQPPQPVPPALPTRPSGAKRPPPDEQKPAEPPRLFPVDRSLTPVEQIAASTTLPMMPAVESHEPSETPTLTAMPAVIPIAEQDTQPRLRVADIVRTDLPWETDSALIHAPGERRNAWWSNLFGKRQS